MKQDNNGGNNYQTQTGQGNTNFLGGQHQHHYSEPQPSLETSLERGILAEYYKKAGELISENYVRNHATALDDKCNDRLGKLKSGFLELTSERIRDANEDILKLCENYGEPFKAHMQDLKTILQKHGACSNQVRGWLEDCPSFLRDQQFVGTAYGLVGYQLYLEGSIEAASDFTYELIKNYPDTPLAYVTQGLIHCRKGNFEQSLKTIRSAKGFYEKQGNRFEELRHFEELEQIVYQFVQQNKPWKRLHQNFSYAVAIASRFLMMG